MRSLGTLLGLRGVALRTPYHETEAFSPDHRILDGFAASGYVLGGTGREIVMAGGANMQARRPLEVHSLKEFREYQNAGAIKIAFDFQVGDAGRGWSRVVAETRVLALDGSSGPAVYWRLMVPGSGLLRRQWLDGIRRRAEGEQ